NSQDSPAYCSLFLCAVPNDEEEKSELAWTKRHRFIASLWLKDAAAQPGWRNIIDPVELNMENYSKEKPVWGFSRFVRKSQVPKEISIGISLQGLTMSTDRITVPVSRSVLPTNLIEAWEDDINNMDISDIKFVVKGRPLYARSSILRRRSEYFDTLLREDNGVSGTRTTGRSNHRRTSFASHDADVESLASVGSTGTYSRVITIDDIQPETFLEMLRFLYTNQVSFSHNEGSGRTVLDLIVVADKYCLYDLKQAAIDELTRNIKTSRIIDTLASIVHKVAGFKQDMVDIVLRNYSQRKAVSVLKQISKLLAVKKQQQSLQLIGQKGFGKYMDHCRAQMAECDDTELMRFWAERTVDAQIVYSLVDFDDELWKKVAGLSLQEAQSVIDDVRKGSGRLDNSFTAQEHRKDRLASADSGGTNEWVIPSSPVDFQYDSPPRVRSQDGQYLRNDPTSAHRSTSCAPSGSRPPNQQTVRSRSASVSRSRSGQDRNKSYEQIVSRGRNRMVRGSINGRNCIDSREVAEYHEDENDEGIENAEGIYRMESTDAYENECHYRNDGRSQPVAGNYSIERFLRE
ncbi:2028_t:CDS:2, partial [Paraglomus occultum]